MQDTQFKNQLIDIDLEGKTLPTVTAADEGKILTVDSSGSWAAAEGSGGGGGVIYLEPILSNGFYDLGISYNELLAYMQSGYMLCEIREIMGSYYIHALERYSQGSGLYGVSFGTGDYSASTATAHLTCPDGGDA